MPGIYGVYHKRPNIKKDATDKLFSAMGKILSHRKSYINESIKLTSLSIGKISFANDPGCIAPVWNGDHSVVLFLDGAIFSYKDGYGSHEVDNYDDIFCLIINEYRQNGTIRTERLNGEFILAIYDVISDRLLLANDRWGFRELYVYEDDDIILFAPEVKSITCYEKINRKLDKRSVIDFFHCGYIMENRAFFKGISLLPSNTRLLIDENGVKEEKSECFYLPSLRIEDYDRHIDTAYQLLDLAVKRRLRKRNYPTFTISGGLDSRLILALAQKHLDNIYLITLGSKKCKEYLIAKQVSEQLGLKNHINSESTWRDIKKYCEWLVWVGDGMISLGFIGPSYTAMCKHISENDLLLGGFGGDHTIGGSRITQGTLTNNLDFEQMISLMLRRTRAVGNIMPFKDVLFQKQFRKEFDYYSVETVKNEFSKASECSADQSYQQDLFLYYTRYRRLLNQARGLLGHISIEQFYPFFDNDFIDFLYSLPPELRFKSKLLKDLYKKNLPQLAKIPWMKTGLSLYQKESKYKKKKKQVAAAFKWYLKRGTLGRIDISSAESYADHNQWYRRHKKFREFIHDILLDQQTIDRGFFREEGIKTILKQFRRGYNYFGLVDRMLVFEIFCRLFLDGESKNIIDNPLY